MKLLLIIGAYDKRHESILRENIGVYAAYKRYPCEIVVMAGEVLAIPGYHGEWRYFDKNLGELFLWKHQEIIKDKMQSDWDLLAFLEDDVLITEDNLDYFVDHLAYLDGTEYMPGFIRYEQWGDDRHLIGLSYEEWSLGEQQIICGQRYWMGRSHSRCRPITHQCGFVLDRRRAEKLMLEGAFDQEPHLVKYGRGKRYYRDLESSTNWIWAYNFRKSCALDDLERAMLLHGDHYKNRPMGLKVEEFIATVSQ